MHRYSFLILIIIFFVASCVKPPDYPIEPRIEFVSMNANTFDELDEDKSGFLEGEEAPSLLRVGGEPTYERLSEGKVEVTGKYVMLADVKAMRNRFYLEADC